MSPSEQHPGQLSGVSSGSICNSPPPRQFNTLGSNDAAHGSSSKTVSPPGDRTCLFHCYIPLPKNSPWCTVEAAETCRMEQERKRQPPASRTAQSTAQDFAPGQPLPTLLEDQPCVTKSVVQVMGETVRVGSSEALCCGSYLHLLGHSPGQSVTGSPAEEATHGGAEQNQQLDLPAG